MPYPTKLPPAGTRWELQRGVLVYDNTSLGAGESLINVLPAWDGKTTFGVGTTTPAVPGAADFVLETWYYAQVRTYVNHVFSELMAVEPDKSSGSQYIAVYAGDVSVVVDTRVGSTATWPMIWNITYTNYVQPPPGTTLGVEVVKIVADVWAALPLNSQLEALNPNSPLLSAQQAGLQLTWARRNSKVDLTRRALGAVGGLTWPTMWDGERSFLLDGVHLQVDVGANDAVTTRCDYRFTKLPGTDAEGGTSGDGVPLIVDTHALDDPLHPLASGETMTAWTGMHTFAPGDQVGVANWLNQFGQNLNHLKERGDRAMSLVAGTNAAVGDLLVYDASGVDKVARTSTQGQAGPILVALDPLTAGGMAGWVRLTGVCNVNTAAAVSNGDLLRVSATAGKAETCPVANAAQAFGIATSNSGGAAGVVSAILFTDPNAVGRILTTLGDLLYRDSTGLARLAGNTAASRKFLRQTGTGSASAAPVWDTLVAGDLASGSANGKLLTIAAGALAWSTLTNGVGVHAYQSGTAQSIPGSAFTPVQLNSELRDNLNNYDSTTNYEFVAPADGVYVVAAGIGLNAIPAGIRFIGTIYLNTGGGYAEERRFVDLTQGGANSGVAGGASLFWLSSGHKLQWTAWHNNGANLTVFGGSQYTYLTVARIA